MPLGLKGNVTMSDYSASLTSLCQSFKPASPSQFGLKTVACSRAGSSLGVLVSLLYLEPTKTPRWHLDSGKDCQHGFF